MSQNTLKHLVISAITQDRSGIVNELSEIITDCQCNIEDSRMVVLGGSFAIIMMVTGSSAQIENLKAQQTKLETELKLVVNMQATVKTESATALPYKLEVVSLDQPGIVNEISDFIAARKINIAELHTETYSAPHTGSTMFKCEMTINVPSDIKIASFRDELFDFCDQKNLDIQLEPYTG